MRRGTAIAKILPFLLMGVENSNHALGEGVSGRGSYHTGGAEFHPKKHPIQTYGAQQRLAKKRKKIRAKSKK